MNICDSVENKRPPGLNLSIKLNLKSSIEDDSPCKINVIIDEDEKFKNDDDPYYNAVGSKSI